MAPLRDSPVTRRGVLAGSAILVASLTGCTTGAPQPAPVTTKDPLEDLLAAHAALHLSYDDAITHLPTDLRLPALRGNVAQHITALAGALALAPPSSASASAPASSAPAPDLGTLIPALAQAESALSVQCRQLAIDQKASRAPLLASLAASHAAASGVLA